MHLGEAAQLLRKLATGDATATSSRRRADECLDKRACEMENERLKQALRNMPEVQAMGMNWDD